MKTMYLRFLLCTILPIFVIPKHPEQIFYGGSISYYLTKSSAGNVSARVELVTGWQLGKGPCGQNCSKASIGQSTIPYRTLVEKDNNEYFGSFTTDYQKLTNLNNTEIRLLNSIVKANMTETVIAVSENAHWEQELLTFSFELLPDTIHEDLNFDGQFWRQLSFRNSSSAWHLQTRIKPGIRNDTGEQNHCPVVLTRPFYRILLNQTTQIDLPTVDDDDDFVKCRDSQYVESGYLNQAFGTTRVWMEISQECSIDIHAFEYHGYKNDTWIAVAINVEDYQKTPILVGDQMQSIEFSMCTTAAQILIHVIDHLVTPVFVSPTLEDKHIFVIFAGAMWATDVYAQAPNTTIDEFTVTGRRQEDIHISSLRNHDEIGHHIRSVQLSWIPDNKYSKHIICVTAVDSYGVESGLQRCFIINLRTQVFNYTLKAGQDKPYFVDVPSTEDLIKCPAEATCIIPIFVKSFSLVENFVDYAAIGHIRRVLRNGEYVYQFDVLFRHSLHEKVHVCLEASNDIGMKTEQLCLKTSIEPPERDICSPNPCIHGTCFDWVVPFFCYCTDDGVNPNDYSGSLCDTKIDDCATNPCNNHSMCIDGFLGSTCDCLTRYNGTECEEDLCPTSNSATSCRVDSSCNFDNDTNCIWHNVHAGDNFDWTLHQGSTPSENTGPTRDHTKETPQGKYYYIETSAPRQANETAWLQSEYLSSSNGETHCLEFWYYMFGTSIGHLNVRLSENTTVSGYNIWSMEGNQGPKWKFAQVTVTTDGLHRIIFEGTVGNGYEGDIALDDIAFKQGNCSFAHMITSAASRIVTSTVPTTTMQVLIGQGCYGDPCVRGVCYVHLDEYFCLCPSGFNGINCEIDTDECRSAPCKNGATCEDGVDKFMCHCPDGYTGHLCETYLDPCHSNPCVRGKCFSHLKLHICICPAGYSGQFCERHFDHCASLPCENNGLCKNVNSSYTCECPFGFSGQDCSKEHGTKCFACKGSKLDSICNTVTTCNSDESCYVDTFLDGDGSVRYHAGCRPSSNCMPSTGDNCTYCCDTDYCNDNGCGLTGYHPASQRGPICFDCDDMTDMAFCKQITQCAPDEMCTVYGSPSMNYDSKCLSKKNQCDAQGGNGFC